jgi:preprotein translocase subunit SecG
MENCVKNNLLLLVVVVLVVVVIVVVVVLNAIEFSPDGSSPNTSTDKTNKNKYT